MSHSYSSNLSFRNFEVNPNWHQDVVREPDQHDNQKKRAAEQISKIPQEVWSRTEQFIRDTGRFALKTPIRVLKNRRRGITWRLREKNIVNTKLYINSLGHLTLMPLKITAMILARFSSEERAKWLLDSMQECSEYLDGCGSQLEAIKEEGIKNAPDMKTFKSYKTWISCIDPKICRE